MKIKIHFPDKYGRMVYTEEIEIPKELLQVLTFNEIVDYIVIELRRKYERNNPIYRELLKKDPSKAEVMVYRYEEAMRKIVKNALIDYLYKLKMGLR